MLSLLSLTRRWLCTAALTLLALVSPAAHAALTSLADEPLATQAGLASAAPNLLFVLDDSGSMDWFYMPDAIWYENWYGYTSPQCNGVAYDPTQTYTPPVKWNGTPYPQAIYTSAWEDGYTPQPASFSTVTLPSTSLTFSTGSKTVTLSPGDALSLDSTKAVVLRDSSDTTRWMLGTVTGSSTTTSCVLLIFCTDTWTYTINVSFFTGKDDASHNNWQAFRPQAGSLGTQSYYQYNGTEPKLSWRYDPTTGDLDTSSNFAQECRTDRILFPWYDRFSRVDINTMSSATTQQNYANWYQYYRNRKLLMKTATGRALLNIPSSYRVGVTKISHSQYGSLTPQFFLQVAPFTEDIVSTSPGQKFNVFRHLYNEQHYNSGGTPLRASLTQVGKYYANKVSGQTDPMTAACQRNYTVLATDGYWNGADVPTDLSGVAIGNLDGSPEVRPMLDTLNAAGTLADIAQYFYLTDLRTPELGNCGSGTSLCTNDSTATTDRGTPGRQNMVTYTLGLGVGGTLRYDPNYASLTTGDFAAIRAGTKNWPNPMPAENATRVDDLWHAAVNGRGRYFSAQNATELSSSLESAIGELIQTPGSGSAVATSAFQLNSTDSNYVYAGSYISGRWTGELKAFSIASDGIVDTTPVWTAQAQLDMLANRNGRTAPAAGVTSPQCGALYSNCNDERVVYFMHPTTRARTAFTYAALQAAGLDADGKFSTSCSASKLSQCTSLSAAQRALANDGKNLVNFIRGDATYEASNGANPLFRLRYAALGDIANGSPAYAGKPPFQYADSGYSDYVTAQASRTKVVYVPANDGMLHAFNALTGQELWAFVPNAVMANLYKLADKNYTHQYFVDGSPVIADIKVSGSWKTILIGGLNKGGKAYYALDVTDPAAPIPLWEYTHANLGFTYGNPVVTKNSAGEWVVAFGSGYNNTGLGYLYVLDAYTGAAKTGSPIATTAGSATTPSGLAPINAWLDSNRDNTARRVYAGDLLGNVWRFDINAGTVAPVVRLQTSSTTPQPITVRPELGSVTYNGTAYPVVMVGTGRYLHANDVSDTALQSVYAIRDKLDSTGWGDVRSSTNLVAKSVTTSGSGTGLTRTATSNTKVDWSTKAGWVFDLRPSSTATPEGERVNTRMQVAYSTLVVAGNIPSAAESCRAAGGSSWLYYFTLADGYTEVAPMFQGNAMVSGVSIVYDASGRAIVITSTSDGKTVRQNQHPTSPPASTGGLRRVSWRELVN